MQVDEKFIRSVVEQVITRLGANGTAAQIGGGRQGRLGLFTDVNQAVAAARDAFEQLSRRTLEDRNRIIGHIRRIAIDQCVELGTMEMEETKIGRLEHKIEKMKILGQRALGVEFLHSEVFCGDHGLAVIEHAPFGVIGAVTPVTHSLPTLTGNAISMIAAGNTVVFNPHPSGRRVATEGVRRYNEAIYQRPGHRQPDLHYYRAYAGYGQCDIQTSGHQLVMRHGRSGSGKGRHAAVQAGDRGRAGQSAGGGR